MSGPRPEARTVLLLLAAALLAGGWWLFRGTAGVERGTPAGGRETAEGAEPLAPPELLVPADLRAQEPVENVRVEVAVADDEEETTEPPASTEPAQDRGLQIWFARVVDGESDAPLPGARVELVTGYPLDGEALQAAVAGPDGIVELDLPARETSHARASAEGFSTAIVRLDRGHEDPGRAKRVRLLRVAALEARVTDAEGTGLSGVRVRVWADSWELIEEWDLSLGFGQEPAWSAETDGEGRCVLEGLPPRVTLSLELHRVDGGPRGGRELLRREIDGLLLEPGERRAVTWTVGAGCTIEGLVLDDAGKPVRAIEVWLGDRESLGGYLEPHMREGALQRTLANIEGRFTFTGVPPGKWLIGPGPTGERFTSASGGKALAPVAEAITIEEGEEFRSLTLTCWRGLYVRGRVLGSDGAPAGKSFVFATADGFHLDANAEADGSFTLGPLAPGMYSVNASNHHGGADAPSERLEVRAGEQDVVLRLGRGGAVRGIVRDESGRPVAKVEVSCSGRSEEGEFHFTWADDGGRFEFKGLPVGEYTLLARSAGSGVALVRGVGVEAGAETCSAEITLAAGGEIVLRFEGGEGWHSYRILVNGCTVALDGIQPGTEVRKTVPPGEYDVELLRWSSEEGMEVLVRETVAVGAGEERAVVLRP